MQSQMRTLWRLGYNVLAFDNRGFGDTPGTPTEEGLYADGRSAYRHLVASRRVGSDRIVLAGRSLGAAVAVQLATRVEAAGLLLLAPIDSVPDVGSRLFPWAPVRLLATHRFDTHASAMQIDLPVIVVHGHPDRMMRLSDTRRLLQSFRGPKLLLQTGGGHHHAGFVDVSSLYRALRHFWPVAPPPTGL
jgi:pimeloyl-ACP methyl ester carboxylesterase